MHEYQITRYKSIYLDTQDLVWAVKFWWHPRGLDFTTDDLSKSLLSEIMALQKKPFDNVLFSDGNTANFCRFNLVPVVYSKVQQKRSRGKYSGFLGVSFDAKSKKWLAQLNHNGNRLLYKRFNTELEAALEYNRLCRDNGLEWKCNEILEMKYGQN